MKILFMIILLSLATPSLGAQKAITDTGEEVILGDDGTWRYLDDTANSKIAIELNKNIFKKPESSSFFLKSTRNNSAFWIDPKKWTFKKGDGDKEYTFRLKGNDLYGMAISETIQIPIESLVDFALVNARDAGADMEIIKKEYRQVNDRKVMYMEMKGTVQGVKFTYFGYYYSDTSGTTQLLAYTGSSLVSKYESEISNFLNGLSLQ